MPRIATYKGGPVIDTEGKHPPCYLNKEFFEYEERITRVVSTQKTNRDERTEYIYNMMIEAQRRWCGACPVRALCLERGLMDNFTGIAGGKYLSKGEVQ